MDPEILKKIDDCELILSKIDDKSTNPILISRLKEIQELLVRNSQLIAVAIACFSNIYFTCFHELTINPSELQDITTLRDGNAEETVEKVTNLATLIQELNDNLNQVAFFYCSIHYTIIYNHIIRCRLLDYIS
jgi:hypothetical protein